jgi:hypothetical protein
LICLLGVFVILAFSSVNYATLNIAASSRR